MDPKIIWAQVKYQMGPICARGTVRQTKLAYNAAIERLVCVTPYWLTASSTNQQHPKITIQSMLKYNMKRTRYPNRLKGMIDLTAARFN